jgi:hypothetical protein
LPTDYHQWTRLDSKFDPKIVRRNNRIIGNLQTATFREQIDRLSQILGRELKLSTSSSELGTVFGRKAPWAYEISAEHVH